MPLFTTLSGLSQTPASNAPDGSVDAPSTLDDQLRLLASFLAQIRDGKGFTNPVPLASSTTTDIGGQNSLAVEISGTTTITSFGVNYNGPRILRFTGSLTLTHNASTLNLPTGANITTAAGDVCLAMPNQGASGWNVYFYQTAATASVPYTHKNKIINGNFNINQRGMSPSSTAYGASFLLLDRWKAGTGGCTMSFATTANVTTVTLTAGTMMQVIEGANLQSGSYTLSWTGTAQARINGGSYANSPIVTTGTGGTNLTVEFGTGTVTNVQLEPGIVATPYEQRQYATELALCQRYFRQIGSQQASQYAGGVGTFQVPVVFGPMRATPSVSINVSSSTNASSIALTVAADGSGIWQWVSAGAGMSFWTVSVVSLNAEL